MLQVTFILSDWILLEQIIASSTPSVLGKADLQKIQSKSFEWGTQAWVKMQRLNAFLCFAFNDFFTFLECEHHKLKNFSHNVGIYKSEKIQQAFWRDKTLKKIPFTLYIYVLAKIIQNGSKFIQKPTSGFRNLTNFRKVVESQNLIGFCPKNTFLQLKHYEDLSKIAFNYCVWNSPNYVCHFWNHKPFLTTQILCIC